MLRRSLITLTLIMSVAALGAAPAALSCGPDTAFESEDVRVWFQGLKGHVKVFNLAQDPEGADATYQFKTAALTEYDGDQAVASMHLGRAFPHGTEACTVEIETETDENGNEAEVGRALTWTVVGDVRAGNASVGTATVTLRWHFRNQDDGTKFDLFVEQWPWQADGELAFAFDVTAAGGFEEAENGLGIRNADGTPGGHISWDAEFTARYDDGEDQVGTVEGTPEVDGNSATIELRFTGVEPGYDELIYDPWVGVGAYLIVGPVLLAESTLQSVLRRAGLA